MDFFILKTLPLKIEVKNSGTSLIPREQIAIGFLHDIIKNVYLIEAIKDEFNESENSEILSGKSIVDNIDFMIFFVEYLQNNNENSFIKAFKSSIFKTKYC